MAKTSLPEGILDRAELQIAPVEKRANLSQRGPIADRLGATPQAKAEVPSRHPFRKSNASSVEVDFEEEQMAVPHPPGNFELPPEKRVKRVLDCYNALVAGIIN